jgi:hypothetical protein
LEVFFVGLKKSFAFSSAFSAALHHSVPGSNILFFNVLGGVCRSRREGQTEEDFRQEIFELIPATGAKSKIVF